ncbi:ficolin-2-like [Saccostrea cucullata]|uniref:ficolin-2-like n=1 Tax=Saccostrea cuccullata TaxID=36930 RepID=UPI002ED4DD3A
MGLRKIIYLLLFVTFGNSSESDKSAMENKTASGNPSSVLLEILNQESLVRFSMVQKIQKLVMDVIDNRRMTQNVKKRLQKVIEDIKTLENREQNLEIENSHLRQKLDVLNETVQIHKRMSKEGTTNIHVMIAELKLKLDDVNIRLQRLESINEGPSVSVNETLGDTVYPMDCLEVMDQGQRPSGIYRIYPWNNSTYKEVLCDMKTMGGGWTVFQKRLDGSVSFSRNWTEYQNGFGNESTEYWLGNDALHALTLKSSSLYVKLQHTNGSHYFQYYSDFRVSGADDDYRLHLGSYSNGTAGDRLRYNNDQTFKTPDHSLTTGCFISYTEGGWWFRNCHAAYLNGVYGSGKWVNPWDGTIEYGEDFRSSQMMARRHN